jgi:hypothetical protein
VPGFNSGLSLLEGHPGEEHPEEKSIPLMTCTSDILDTRSDEIASAA